MKKYHLYLWIIALIGMITSCSQNETDALQNANNKMVSITASLPVDFVQPNPQSRAALPEAPDDQYKLRCILEIWDEELTTLKVRKEVCPAAGAEKIDFTFELDNGEYHALLWADYVGKNAVAQATAIAGLSDVQHYADRWYETNNATGLKEVRVMAMDVKFEKQDAFFAAKPFTKEATALKDLAATLTRAVAKLTIAEKSTTNFAYCKSVEFKYNVLTTLDVSTGIVSGTASFANVYGSGNAGFGEDITINGGTVTAEGGDHGAGIGGGAKGSGSNVTVSGAAQVTATATGSGPDWSGVGTGATIGNGGSKTPDGPVDGKEIQADISHLTTGYIHHIIYNPDLDSDGKPDGILKEWWEFALPKPIPDGESLDLHVETLKGAPLLFNTRQQGSTLRVTTDNLSARLHGTRQALETLQEQGVEQIQFVTTLKTTTLSVADLLAEGGSWFALEHDGLGSRRLSAAQAESLKCRMR